MTNADVFHSQFGIYASELWAMPEKEFLDWLNSEYRIKTEIDHTEKVIKGLEHELQNRGKCGHYCRNGFETIFCEFDKDGLCIQHWGKEALSLLKALTTGEGDAISRKALLAAYDAAHQGPPGGARKLIEEAPTIMEKVHEPKVMTLDEVRKSDYVYIQNGENDPKCLMFHFTDDTYIYFTDQYGNSIQLTKINYMKRWRCWTSKPSRKQMEATPWAT